MGELGVFDHHAGVVEAGLQFALERRRDFVLPRAQRDLRMRLGFTLVIGVARREVADGCLGLDPHIGLVILDIEDRLRGVAHTPDDGGRDLDRIAAQIVDLELVAVEVVRAQTELALFVERIGPTQAFAAVGALVRTEQQHHRRFIGLQHVHARRDEQARENQRHREQQGARPEQGHLHQGRHAGQQQQDGHADHQVAAGARKRNFGGTSLG